MIKGKSKSSKPEIIDRLKKKVNDSVNPVHSTSRFPGPLKANCHTKS